MKTAKPKKIKPIYQKLKVIMDKQDYIALLKEHNNTLTDKEAGRIYRKHYKAQHRVFPEGDSNE